MLTILKYQKVKSLLAYLEVREGTFAGRIVPLMTLYSVSVVRDKQKSKRKKDGVFYTPKYITKYIVENTVGKLCQEKKD